MFITYSINFFLSSQCLLSSYIVIKLNVRLLEVHTSPSMHDKCVICIYQQCLEKLESFACEFSRLLLWASWFCVVFLCCVTPHKSINTPQPLIKQESPGDPTNPFHTDCL